MINGAFILHLISVLICVHLSPQFKIQMALFVFQKLSSIYMYVYLCVESTKKVLSVASHHVLEIIMSYLFLDIMSENIKCPPHWQKGEVKLCRYS